MTTGLQIHFFIFCKTVTPAPALRVTGLESWFNYQVLRDDGSVEMNCLIELVDFIEVPPSEGLMPTKGQRFNSKRDR